MRLSSSFSSSDILRAEKRLQAVLAKRDEAKRLEASLIEFVRAAWPILDPSSGEYQESDAIDALCLHLEAVTRGQCKRLLINFPPRCGKTSVASVLWPLWTWIQSDISYTSGPQVRFLTGSYGQTLSLKIALDARRVIESRWFQELWGTRVKLSSDQAAKGQYDTTAGGTRLSTSVGGSLLGVGGSIIVVDDPHNVRGAESEADRETVQQWWQEISSTRLNDPRQSAIVVIMQRLHQQDVSGLILDSDRNGEWTHVCLPMRYDPQRHSQTDIWEDWRSKPGELLWPERFNEKKLAEIEQLLGPYAAAGRLQQSPVPAGGGIIKREWWQLWDDHAAKINGGLPGKLPSCSYIVASLDTAYTSKEENDPSACTIWGAWTDVSGVRRFILMYAWSERLELHDLVERVAQTCKEFRVSRILIEARAAGHSVAQELRRRAVAIRDQLGANRKTQLHADFSVQLVDPKRQDKVARVHAVVPLFSAGLIFAPNTKWADQVIEECKNFPKGSHDDLVDTTSMALAHFRAINLAELPDEFAFGQADELTHRGPQQGFADVFWKSITG